MVGYADMQEVMIWLQTTESAKVKIRYAEQNKTNFFFTDEITTSKVNGFTAKLICDKVWEGKSYNYEVFINNKPLKLNFPTTFKTQKLWQHRTDAPDFKVAMGSCNYINDEKSDWRDEKPYGRSPQIFKTIASKNPDVMLWLGDNVYLREPDWNTKTGIYNRYTMARSIPEIQPLIANTSNYAIWDDHDFGPNDGDRGFYNKDITNQAFTDFWANPAFGNSEMKGTMYTFWRNDVQFFMLDDRTYRTPHKRTEDNRTLLGKQQLNWLIDQLTYSKAAFKVICMGSQVLNPAKVKENYSNYPEEFNQLMAEIEKNKIEGIMFFSGDRHHTEITKMPRNKHYPLYDFTISPLTSSPHNTANEPNYFREPNTYISDQNFGIMDVTGSKNDRKITVTVFDISGKEIWKKEIFQKELLYTK
jgi:alkaline phosphatase D